MRDEELVIAVDDLHRRLMKCAEEVEKVGLPYTANLIRLSAHELRALALTGAALPLNPPDEVTE